MELCGVVPPWGGFAAVMRSQLPQVAGGVRPREGIVVVRKRRPEGNLDACADWEFNGLYVGHRGGAVAFGAQSNSLVTGRNNQGTTGGKDCASNDTQTVTER